MSSEKRSIFKDVLHLAGLEKSDRKSPATVTSDYSNSPKSNDTSTSNTSDATEMGALFFNPVWAYCNQYQTLLQRYAAMGAAAASPQSDQKFENDGQFYVTSVTTKQDVAAAKKTNLPLVKPTMAVMNHSNDNNSIGNKSSPPRFQCSDCSRSYSTFSGLSKHKQFHCVLQQKKQFGCKFCEKQYSSLGALKMHIRTHTLPCKCEICGKAFSRPWLLQGHMRTHTGERPFLCSHCGRAFADRSNLRAHLQTHSEVRKYRCKSCQKTFSRLSLLNKHETNRNKIEYLNS